MSEERYATLDVIRGVAVMGILLANIVAFGLPEAAYFSPLAWGGSEGIDRVAWFANFLFVEGRMRGLFSFLFGASMLLVIERAEANGRSGAQVHVARMFWLFVIGCLHLYLLWWGDILAHYALVGTVALLFARLSVPALLIASLFALVLAVIFSSGGAAALFAAAPQATAAQVASWDAFALAFGVPPAAHLQAEIAAVRGSLADAVAWRWNHAMNPFQFLAIGGAETLSAVLLGMGAYRSGFITGAWQRRRYVLVAAILVPLSLAGYAALGLNTLAHDLDQRWVYVASIVASAPFRVLGYIGYAALVILLVRPGGSLTIRVGAAGRMAFTNYLGTTIVMDLVFTGVGLARFGTMQRASLYLLVPVVWAMMLLGSKPWLERFSHGPFEWAWRSLARGRMQPFRRPAIS